MALSARQPIGALLLGLAVTVPLTAAPTAAADVFEYSNSGDVLEHLIRKPKAALTPRKTLNPAHKAYLPIVAEASATHDVPVDLILAMIQAESDFKPDVYSVDDNGEPLGLGLMQLTAPTAERFGLTDIEDVWLPSKNIDTGTKYLAWLLDHFQGDFESAVAAYNAGEGNVAKYGGIPPFPETVAFVARVERFYGKPFDRPAPPSPNSLAPYGLISEHPDTRNQEQQPTKVAGESQPEPAPENTEEDPDPFLVYDAYAIPEEQVRRDD